MQRAVERVKVEASLGLALPKPQIVCRLCAVPRDHHIVRDGKDLKGRVLGFVLGTIGRRVLERAFENSVKAIEARNSAAAPSTNGGPL